MLLDARGVAHSTSSDAAIQRYETALNQFQSYRGDVLATLEEALAADPQFASAQLFKAFALYTLTEKKYVPDAVQALQAAEALKPQLTAREKQLLAAGKQLVRGQWDDAARSFDEVLQDHPRDALALQTAHLMDFLRGDAANLRNRVARVLPHWSASMPGYSYVQGMFAFGLEECNQYPEAERVARQALEIEPVDGWSVHAVTHVMEMQGRIDEGIAWLESREADWAPDNGFAFHNWWHLALFYLDRGDYERVLHLYDTAIPRGLLRRHLSARGPPPAMARGAARPGQFVIVMSHPEGERIPLTIADFDRDRGTVTLVIQAVGKTTREMQRDCQVGTRCTRWSARWASRATSAARRRCCASAAGSAWRRSTRRRAASRKRRLRHRRVGFRNRDLMFWEDKFRAVCDELIICTDDGSAGIKGLVTEGIRQAIEQAPGHRRSGRHRPADHDERLRRGHPPARHQDHGQPEPGHGRRHRHVRRLPREDRRAHQVRLRGRARFRRPRGRLRRPDGAAGALPRGAQALARFEESCRIRATRRDRTRVAAAGGRHPCNAAEDHGSKKRTIRTIPQERTPMPSRTPQERARNFRKWLRLRLEEALRRVRALPVVPDEPCVRGCPVGIDIPGFIRKIGEKNFRGAYDVITDTNLLPAVCGRVCPQETSARACARWANRSSRWPSAGSSASSATWRSARAGATCPTSSRTASGRHRRLRARPAWPAPPTWPRPAARSRCSRPSTRPAACSSTAFRTSGCPTRRRRRRARQARAARHPLRVQHAGRAPVHDRADDRGDGLPRGVHRHRRRLPELHGHPGRVAQRRAVGQRAADPLQPDARARLSRVTTRRCRRAATSR
jgi:tetratricopeptide (TPR) repeat protein